MAAALRERGFKVTGSDENVYPPMSLFLKEVPRSRKVIAKNIPADADVVLAARRRQQSQVEAVLSRKLLYLSLPEVLKNYFLRTGIISCHWHPRQTTTTALLTWIMERPDASPVISSADSRKSRARCTAERLGIFRVEGDEYDTAFFDKRSKFIHCLPELLIVNNIEFDRADIFNDLEIKLASTLLNIVPQNGIVLLNGDDICVEVAKIVSRR